MAKGKKKGIATLTPQFERLEAMRALPRLLRSGPLGVQSNPQDFLFRHPREGQKEYRRRVDTLVLEPWYWGACEHLGSQPFTKAEKLPAGFPTRLEEVIVDIDGNGRDLRTMARAAAVGSVGYGNNFALVRWDEEEARPYVHEIPSWGVLDPYRPGVGMRILVMVDPPDAASDKPWESTQEEQIWILRDGDPSASGDAKYASYEVYRREDPTDPDSEWSEFPDPGLGGTFAPEVFIPLFPIPTGTGDDEVGYPWIASPPLYPLAVMNRSHTNKVSDLDAGLAIANIPQRAASGLSDQEAGKLTKVSFNGLWWMMNPSGKFYYVEHSGAAFGIAAQDRESLERRMEVFGLSPLVSEPAGGATAMGRKIDLTRATVTAQAWAMVWQYQWNQILRCMSRYLGTADTFTVEFDTTFGPAKAADLDRARIVQNDYLNGDLPASFYYPEMKRLGVYGEGFDAERASVEAEAKAKAREDALNAMPAPRKTKPGTTAGDQSKPPSE